MIGWISWVKCELESSMWGRRRGTRCLSQEDCCGQSAKSCGRLGARQKRGYKSPMKEFKPCSWERVLGYAKETSEPRMFGVEVPENSR